MEIKNIEIKFEFQEKFVTIKAEAYRTIKEVKEKAMKTFFNIPQDIHCFYLGRDLSIYENNNIGDFFNNREKVSLKLMPQKKSIFGSKKNIGKKKGEVVFSDIYLNTKVFSSGFNNIGRFQNIKLKESNSLDKKEKKKQKKLKLPLINNIYFGKKLNSINQRYNLITDNIINDDNNEDEEKYIKCENCNNNKFTEYCRNCKEFVCVNCKKIEKHINHLFIHLDPSYESSIQIYGKIILTDIEYFKTNNNSINKDENIVNNSSSILHINELNVKRNKLVNKLKNIMNIYEKIINKLKNEIILDGKTKIIDLINKYNNDSLKINNNINQILKKLQDQKEKININDFKLYFQEMNDNEEKLININKKIFNIHLTSQLNNKINSMIDKMEKIADETIQEKNNLFNLAYNFSEELENIINKNQIKENVKNITRNIKENSHNIKRNYQKSKTSLYGRDKILKEENIND